MHAPYGHPDIVPFLSAIKLKYAPTRVVIVGDEVDKHGLSFHDKDPDLFAAGDELELAVTRLGPIYRLFPVADVLESNHGSLAFRKAKHHGIPRKYLKGYNEVLGAPVGWKWHMDLVVPAGDRLIYFHHGISANVMKAVERLGVCVVQGHYHTKFEIAYTANPNALLWGMTVGCLIDDRSLAFAYNKLSLARPVLGCGLIVDGRPKLLPMILEGGRWNGTVD